MANIFEPEWVELDQPPPIGLPEESAILAALLERASAVAPASSRRTPASGRQPM